MLNYSILNNNKTEWLTLVHCLGGSIKTWQKQINMLSNHFNILIFDLPYHGKSLSFAKKLTNKNVNDAIKEVLDNCNITKTYFLGFSLGTIVIANFVSQYPEYSNKIVLAGCSTMVAGIYKPLINIIKTIKCILPCKLAYKFMASIMLPKSSHKKSRNIFIREITLMNTSHFHEWVDYISQITNFEKTINSLNKRHCEVLILTGNRDFCFIDGAKKTHKLLTNSQIKIIKKCGHVCIIEQPDIVNNLTIQFLS